MELPAVGSDIPVVGKDASVVGRVGAGLLPACRRWRSGMNAFAAAMPAAKVILRYIFEDFWSELGQRWKALDEKPESV